MKYSIRGNLRNTEGDTVIPLLQSFIAWRLTMENDWDTGTFQFEIWLAEDADRSSLFQTLKASVNLFGGSIDWHECTHDQQAKQPCVIAETYAGG